MHALSRVVRASSDSLAQSLSLQRAGLLRAPPQSCSRRATLETARPSTWGACGVPGRVLAAARTPAAVRAPWHAAVASSIVVGRSSTRPPTTPRARPSRLRACHAMPSRVCRHHSHRQLPPPPHPPPPPSLTVVLRGAHKKPQSSSSLVCCCHALSPLAVLAALFFLVCCFLALRCFGLSRTLREDALPVATPAAPVPSESRALVLMHPSGPPPPPPPPRPRMRELGGSNEMIMPLSHRVATTQTGSAFILEYDWD